MIKKDQPGKHGKIHTIVCLGHGIAGFKGFKLFHGKFTRVTCDKNQIVIFVYTTEKVNGS